MFFYLCEKKKHIQKNYNFLKFDFDRKFDFSIFTNTFLPDISIVLQTRKLG